MHGEITKRLPVAQPAQQRHAACYSCAAEERDQQSLSEQAAQDARSFRSKGQAKGQFTRTVRNASGEQATKVGARC